MKKVIFIGLLMTLLATAKSQVSISVPVGVSTLKVPTMGVETNLRIKGLIFGAGFQSHISRDITKGALWYTKLGAALNLSELNTAEISLGAAQYRRSSDVKSLNAGLALLNVQFVHQMESRPEASVFGGILATKEFAIFSGGLRFTFGRNYRINCK